MTIEYYQDDTIKLEYGAVINKFGFQINQIGAQEPTDIEEADFTYSDSNSIFVSDTGSDTAPGTQANPVATIEAAIDLTDDDKVYVIIESDSVFYEDLSSCTFDYLQGVYAGVGYTPDISFRVLDYTPSDSNTIWVSKSGNDTTGDGSRSNPYLTIAKAITDTDSSHEYIMIDDSGTYEEEGFKFTSHFKNLYASEGEAPTIQIKFNRDYYETEIDEVASLVHTGTGTGSGYSSATVKLNSGVIVTMFAEGSVGINWYKYDHDHTLLDSGTVGSLPGAGVVNYIAATEDGNGDIILILRRTTPSITHYYCKIESDSMDVTGTPVDIGYSGYIIYDCCCNSDFSKLYLSIHANAGNQMGYAVISTNDQSTLKSYSVLEPDVGNLNRNFGICRMGNGNLYILYGVVSAGFYPLYSAEISDVDYSIVSSRDALSITGVAQATCLELEDGLVGIAYGDGGAGSQNCYLRVIDPTDNSVQKSDLTIYSGNFVSNMKGTHSTSGHISITPMIYDAGGDYPLYIIGVINKSDRIQADVDFKIDGIILQPYDEYWLDKFININIGSGSADSFFEWCSFEEMYIEENKLQSYILYSDDAIDMYNCWIESFSQGLYTESNNVDIQDCQFVFGYDGYCIHVDGAGSGIIIEHCDLFNNYGALRLENNNGSEVIKNNIFHDNDNGSVLDTATDADNSAITDSNTNMTVGSKYIRANPLYIDEGAVNPANLDLNIKTQLLGYQTDSPAYNLADDDRNSGAINVQYIGSETVWSNVEIQKADKINPKLTAVNSSFNQRRSGDVASSKDGQTLFVEMIWNGMLIADVEDIEKVWCNDSSTVRIYFQPTTNPTSYETFKIKYSDIDEGAEVYTLGDIGSTRVQIIFGRAYEL